MLGHSLMIILIIVRRITIGAQSFTAKYGKNFILSTSGFLPRGLEDPVLCSIIR